jgi:hypothetical protein
MYSAAQSSIEFMVVMAIFLAILLVGIVVSLQKTEEINSAQAEFEARKVLTDIETKLHTVLIGGSGFSTNLTIPHTLLGANYSLTMQENILYLELFNVTYIEITDVTNVSGTPTKGVNVLENINGVITIHE